MNRSHFLRTAAVIPAALVAVPTCDDGGWTIHELLENNVGDDTEFRAGLRRAYRRIQEESRDMTSSERIRAIVGYEA